MIQPAETVATTSLEPTRDGRLVPYCVITFGVLIGALLFGEGALAALAAPFAVALALGLRRSGPVEVTARLVLDSEQVLEGDVVTGRVEVTWSSPFDAQVLLHRLKGVSAATEDDVSARAGGASAVELPIRLQATRWGRHSVGEVWLRLTLPFGLVTWTGKVLEGPSVRVLPDTERLNRLLAPARPRAVWGMHRTTRLGDGHEFAELRAYVPGDRLRDLNWAATARQGKPFVNRHHPHLSGDVVIALDAFDDGWAGAEAVLARSARIAWGLASLHMRANDRVGLVGLGGSTQWLAPAGGRLAEYRLMETLLRVGGEAADRILSSRQDVEVPPAALILALTSLHDRETLRVLTRWRARGRSVAVVMIDVLASLDAPDSRGEALAMRVWGLELERRIGELEGLGVPVVRAPLDGAVTPVITALQRKRRGPPPRVGR